MMGKKLIINIKRVKTKEFASVINPKTLSTVLRTLDNRYVFRRSQICKKLHTSDVLAETHVRKGRT